MNILVLATDVFSKGGIPRYIQYQIKALKSISAVKNLYVFSLSGRDEKNYFEGVNLSIDYIGKGITLWSKILFTLWTLIFSRNKRIDFILCNHVCLAPIAFFAKKLFGIRYVVDVYGLEIWSGLNAIEIASLRNADGIIGDCEFILKFINDKFGIGKEKLFLLYDCVDMNIFRSQSVPKQIFQKYGIPENKKIIMNVGRLVYNKGQENIIKILKFLPQDVISVIVGGGPKIDEWKDLARKNGVAQRAFFTGRVIEGDLVSIYNIADIFVYLSRFISNEGGGLPLVIIEASACEKPIIASNEDGAKEAVEENKNGFIISPEDEGKLVERIKYFIDNPTEAKKMGEYGRKKTDRDFSYENFKNNLEKIIKTYN